MTTTPEETADSIIALPLIAIDFALMLPSALFVGYTMSCLYEWHVRAIIAGPEIGTLAATGVALLIGMIMHKNPSVSESLEAKKHPALKVAKAALGIRLAAAMTTGLYLLLGWLLHLMGGAA
jgi:hypothetical protein